MEGIIIPDKHKRPLKLNTRTKMTAKEFKAAFRIANDESVDLSNAQDTNLFGFARSDFQPITTTVTSIAELIRYQGLYLSWTCENTKWDVRAVDEIRTHGRKKFIVVG